MFRDPRCFSFAVELESAWREIHQEFLGVAGDTFPWPEETLHQGGWEVFGLFGFPHGEPISVNIQRCPVTAELIDTVLPQHGAAGFSVLAPGTRIAPHEGYQGDTLRCHLGLEVPGTDCGLNVGGETRHWQAGETLIFDDRILHSAWNLSAHRRVVLLVDFVPDK